MIKILYVGLGGCIGAILRYIISTSTAKLFTSGFPFGTLIVNVLGGFFMGLIMELTLSSETFPPHIKLFLTTGIMGGLTTFSTFSYETVNLFLDGRLFTGSLNIMFNLFLSLGALYLGRIVTHFLF